jgi:hypothetical protein
MHLAEMSQMTGDIARLLPTTGLPTDQPLRPISALYRTFTAEQLNQSQQKQPLTFAHLLPEQQKLLHLAIVNNMVSDGRSRWERVHDTLLALPRARMQFQIWQGATAKRDPVQRDLSQVAHKVQEGLVCHWQDAQGQERTTLLLRTPSLPDVPDKQKDVPVVSSPSDGPEILHPSIITVAQLLRYCHG